MEYCIAIAHQLMFGRKSKWCAIFLNHIRSQIIRVLTGNRIPSPARDFNDEILCGRAGKVISKKWWSPRNKEGQKTSPPQMPKRQGESGTVREPGWGGVLDEWPSLQSPSDGGRQALLEPCLQQGASGKETPEPFPLCPPIFSLQSLVCSQCLRWLNPVGNQNDMAPGDSLLGSGWDWEGQKMGLGEQEVGRATDSN